MSGTSDLTMVSRTRRRGVDDATRRDDSTRKKDHWYWDRATKGPRSVDEIEKNRFDVHGAEGLFGYFPTYSLGNVYAGCLHQALRAATSRAGNNGSSAEIR